MMLHKNYSIQFPAVILNLTGQNEVLTNVLVGLWAQQSSCEVEA